jgi:hypothetical protein
MAAIIKLQTCFKLPEAGSELTFLPEGVETVRDLLLHMGHQIDFSFIDPVTSSMEEDLEIILNNKEIWFYPTVLDTFLNDGDSLEIYLRPLGGG